MATATQKITQLGQEIARSWQAAGGASADYELSAPGDWAAVEALAAELGRGVDGVAADVLDAYRDTVEGGALIEACDYRTGDAIGTVDARTYQDYLLAIDGDPIGAVDGARYGFDGRTIYMDGTERPEGGAL